MNFAVQSNRTPLRFWFNPVQLTGSNRFLNHCFRSSYQEFKQSFLNGRLNNYHSRDAKSWCNQFLVGVCDKIDKIQREFLWGSENGSRELSLVNWDTLCTPKSMGGLGIQSTKDMNMTLFSKLGWKLCSNESSLWSEVIKAKYLTKEFFLQVQPKANASYTWKSILWAKELLEKGITWAVSSGTNVRFWLDTWLHNQPLDLEASTPLTEQELNQNVREFWNEGTWNWDMLRDKLPTYILELLALYSLHQDQREHDVAHWKTQVVERFSTKSAYATLSQGSEHTDKKWKKIWDLCVLPKNKFFLWLIYHDRVLTNELRYHRN